ncbi:hypothetical protein PHYC_00873 [Phycisphaerales bacterium]|nr:hypothetical protein PHYC_00873 [Phycisphaerales bacterium]
MSDERSPPHGTHGQRPARPKFLSAFLDQHGIACEGCGYNLRGCRDPYCPECGRVIARPTLDQQERARSPEFPCRLCGRANTHTEAQCECCGEPRRALFQSASGGPWRVWAGVPKALRLWALLSSVQFSVFAMLAMVAGTQPGWGRGPESFALSAFISVGPLLLIVAWRRQLHRIARVSPGPRAWLVHGVGTVCAVLMALAWAIS